MSTLYTDIQKLVKDHCDAVVCVNGSMLARDLRGLLEKHAPGENPDLNELERLLKEANLGKLTNICPQRGAKKSIWLEESAKEEEDVAGGPSRYGPSREYIANCLVTHKADFDPYANAALFAAAVNALPGLIDRVRELEKVVDDWRMLKLTSNDAMKALDELERAK